jgi:hypothetical protein
MLGTGERILLVDALAPPATTYRLDRAVATTFTLDLTALIPVPMAFAGRDLREDLDPLSLLQAIRHYAGRIDVYCQAGHIQVEQKFQSLLAFLEPVVHPIAPPQGHLFHPKVWVARYRSSVPDEPDRFRFVCGSRNITNDRAWDAVVSLEGMVGGRNRSQNAPIADFVASLPGRSQHKHSDRAEAVLELSEDIRRVKWEVPPECDKDVPLHFHVFGPGRRPRPNLSGSKRLVVSPFLNDKGIELTCEVDNASLKIVSRPESFDSLGVETKEWIATPPVARCYVMNDGAAIPSLDSDKAIPRWSLSGLHAKIYVAERDRRAHVFIGSANATDAAWHLNDEVLVELVGQIRSWGINSFLPDLDTQAGEAEDRDQKSFRSVLLEYVPGESAVDDDQAELEKQMDEALRSIASMPMTAIVRTRESGTWSEQIRCSELLTLPQKLPAPAVRVGLLSDPAQLSGWDVDTRLDIQLDLAEVDLITPFLVIELEAGPAADRLTRRTVIIAQLTGDPDDRLDRILARLFRDKETFLRFLMLLLALSDDGATGSSLDLLMGGTGKWTDSSRGLMEALVTALASRPAAIDDIARIVKSLERSEHGREVLPPGWDDLWDSIKEARTQIRRHPEDRA